MSEPKRLIIGGQPLPLDIGSLVENESSCMGLELAPIQFEFSYRDVRFACRCDEWGGDTRLKVVGDAGPMPFSAESPAARAALQAIFDEANAALGPVFKVGHGRVLLGTDRSLPKPVSATALMTAVSMFLLPARGYLDLLAEIIRPPLAAARPGETALRPSWRRNPPKSGISFTARGR